MTGTAVLLMGPTATGKIFPTATLARLALPSGWDDLPVEGCKLLDLVRPRELSKD